MAIAQVSVFVVGDRFKGVVDQLTRSLTSIADEPVTVHFCSDAQFSLSRIPIYADYSLIVVNWGKFAVLLANFLETHSNFKSKLVLVSGLYRSPKNPSLEEIMGYGLFDYFISSTDPNWTGQTWQQVLSELKTKPPKKKQLSFEKSVGYYAYAWKNHDFRHGSVPAHFKTVMDNSGSKCWTDQDITRLWAFNSFPDEFREEIRIMSNEVDAKPVWGKPVITPGLRSKCFVLMPFKHPFTEVYDDFVKPTVESLGVSCLRADDFYTTNAVMTDIWNGINNCLFLIAELTGRNSNVMYELGIAHTLGKEVILLCQDSEDVPFDFKHMRYYRYDYTPRGCDQLKVNLAKAIAEIQNKP